LNDEPVHDSICGPYNRLVKIYTRTGDAGETGLFDGQRVSKSDSRVEAYGDVDELNATIGLVLAEPLDAGMADALRGIQRDLFAIGGRLADPSRKIAGRVDKVVLSAGDIARLEALIDSYESELPPLRRFILPGGSRPAALLHLARTVCRRAERRIVLLERETVEAEVLAYVNRLSDLLFVLARVANVRAGIRDIEW
jgi:cob(I)alamin adenosyltransferase